MDETKTGERRMMSMDQSRYIREAFTANEKQEL